MEFNLFTKELLQHGKNGYHLLGKDLVHPVNDAQVIDLVKELSIEYVNFMNNIGSGSFYCGSLQLFNIKNDRFKDFNRQLQEMNCNDFVAIGYNGTTEGCFCLKKDHRDNSLYWVSWNDGIPFQLSDSFHSWIENTPQELFNEKIFNGFKSIKDIVSINYVIDQRRKINLRLLSFDKELISHPNEAKKYLKRYNKICFEIVKTEKMDIEWVTIKMLRSGSSVGSDNVEYVTIDVEKIAPLKTTRVKAFLFDPFNLPFENIVCLYTPEIDLSSPMRTAFKEIAAYL